MSTTDLVAIWGLEGNVWGLEGNELRHALVRVEGWASDLNTRREPLAVPRRVKGHIVGKGLHVAASY